MSEKFPSGDADMDTDRVLADVDRIINGEGGESNGDANSGTGEKKYISPETYRVLGETGEDAALASELKDLSDELEAGNKLLDEKNEALRRDITELKSDIESLEARKAELLRQLESDNGRDILNKTKENKGAKKFFSGKFKTIMAGVLAALAVFAAAKIGIDNGLFGGADENKGSSDLSSATSSMSAKLESADQTPIDVGEEAEIKSLTGYEVLDKAVDGSFLQYDNVGCHESDGKTSDSAVGNPNAVLEAMGINPEEATAEQRGAVQEFFAYSMEEPAASVAIAGKFEGFDGLTQEEAEDKIHNMSKEEKSKLQDQLKEFFDKTEYHYENGSGTYRNQCIYEDGNGGYKSDFIKSDLTGKRVLVGATAMGNGWTAVWVSKEDCGNNEDRITLVSPDGGTSIVVTFDNPPGTPPETPPGTPPETPPETIKEKDAENSIRIDKDIEEQHEENLGTEDFRNYENEGVNTEEQTEAIADEAYGGTEAIIVENEATSEATPVQEEINEENNYSENLGGAHADEYAPVEEDSESQEAADEAHDDNAASGEDIEDILGSILG